MSVAIISLSLFIIYNFFTVIFTDLPYLDLYHGGNILILCLNGITVRWSGVAGFSLLLIGVLSLIFKDFRDMKLPALIVGVIFSVCLIL